jgi:hypothetical protein
MRAAHLFALALAGCAGPSPDAALAPGAGAPTSLATARVASPSASASENAPAALGASSAAAAHDVAGACAAPAADIEEVARAPKATVFTTDGADLFWSDGHAIWTEPVTGGAPSKIVEDASAVSRVQQLEVDGDQLWVAARREVGGGCLGFVGFTSRKGGRIEKVGPAGCPENLALTAREVVFAHEGTDPGGGQLVGTVYVAPRKKGAKAVVLRRGFNGSSRVGTDGSYAYFSESIGTLDRVPLSNGPVEHVTSGKMGSVLDDVDARRGFVADERYVYFFHGHLNLDGLRLFKIEKAGGLREKLGEALPKTRDGSDYPLAGPSLDATHVYWSSPGEGEVRRVDKENACGVQVVASGRPRPDWVVPTPKFVYWLETGVEPARIVRRAL